MRLCPVILWVFMAGGLAAPVSAAAEDQGYLPQLLRRARLERLAERTEWRSLLHYKPRTFSQGFESQVDAGSFFLSPQGKYDPEAELEATLSGFFADAGSDPENSPQCRFVARYQWLREALDIDPARLPEIGCGRFHKWFEEMNPAAITLVFPSAYLNNPASMFGHTLLRIDAQGQDAQTRLLAYTINYAADSRQEQGFRYALNGLFGSYHGRFSFAPYFVTVKAYGDIENRDIWEFGLNLSREEIGQLLRHVWEMRSAWFDYYFLDENCSYHLLSLLETARPGLGLTDRFKGWAIPSETVRAVAEAGLLTGVRFRPARNTVLKERAARMDGALQNLAKGLALGDEAADSDSMRRLGPADQARVIELALDYSAYLHSPRFGGEEQKTGVLSNLLKARSRLDVPDQTPEIPAPGVWPGQGHKPARAGIGYGIGEMGHFIEVTAAPAYHDIIDPQGGFTHGAGVTLLDTAFRFYPEDGKGRLERIDIIDIISLSSFGRFLRPVSWKAAIGVERKDPGPSGSFLVGRLSGGIGVSRDFSGESSAHAFAEGTVEMSDRFDFFAAPGVGPRIGFVHDFSARWRTGISFLWQLFFLNEWRNDYAAVMENRFTVTGQSIAGIALEWKREFGNARPEARLYWQFYF